MTTSPTPPSLWPRARTVCERGTLRHATEPVLYDPFRPALPLPEAPATPHDMRPWSAGPLLVDALLRAELHAAGAEAFAGEWGLLTSTGDTEALGDLVRAAVEFRLVCAALASGEPLPVEDVAPHLARVYPIPLATGGVRWGFATLLEAAYWQLACFLMLGEEIRVCAKPSCQNLFVGLGKKRHCSANCSGAKRAANMRERRREEER